MKKTILNIGVMLCFTTSAFSQTLNWSATVKNSNWDYRRTKCVTIDIRPISDTSVAILSVQALAGTMHSKDAEKKKTTGGKIVDFLSGSNSINNDANAPGMPIFFETIVGKSGREISSKRLLVPSVEINKDGNWSFEPNNSIFTLSRNEQFDNIKNDFKDLPTLFAGFHSYPGQPLQGKSVVLREEGSGLLGNKNPKPFPVTQTNTFTFQQSGASTVGTTVSEENKNVNKTELKGYRSLHLPFLTATNGNSYGLLYNDAEDNGEFKNFSLLEVGDKNNIISKQEITYPYCVTWEVMTVNDTKAGDQKGLFYFSQRADVKSKYLDPEINKYEFFLLGNDGKIQFKNTIKLGTDDNEYHLCGSFVSKGILYFMVQRDTKKDKSFEIYKVSNGGAEKVSTINPDDLNAQVTPAQRKEHFLAVYNGTFNLCNVTEDVDGNIVLLGTLFQHIRLMGAHLTFGDVHIVKLDAGFKLSKYYYNKLTYPYQTDYAVSHNYDILSNDKNGLSAVINYRGQYYSIMKLTKDGLIVNTDILMKTPNTLNNAMPVNFWADKVAKKIYVFNNSTVEPNKVEIRVVSY